MGVIAIHILLTKIAVALYIVNKIKAFVESKILKTRKELTKEEFIEMMKDSEPDEIKVLGNVTENIVNVLEENSLLIELIMFILCFVPMLNILSIVLSFLAICTSPNKLKK